MTAQTNICETNPNVSCIALIPARSGSKRVPHKNTRLLGNVPLLGWTIAVALQSGVFSRVLVSTEDPETADLARAWGADVPFLRPAEFAQDQSPDIDWIRHVLQTLDAQGTLPSCFAILRPTSPFRTTQMIQRAWEMFLADPQADSLRAVEKCSQHPAKMWQITGNRMAPVMANPNPTETPWHSMPYQALPPVYVQNASLEIARCSVPLTQGTIAGAHILPFITQGLEGFDINTPEDWVLAEHYLQTQAVSPPRIKEPCL